MSFFVKRIVGTNTMYVTDLEDNTDYPLVIGATVYGFCAHVLRMGENGDVVFRNIDEIFAVFNEQPNDLEIIRGIIDGKKRALSAIVAKEACQYAESYKKAAIELMNEIKSIHKSRRKYSDYYLNRILEKFKWFGYKVLNILPLEANHNLETEYYLHLTPTYSDDLLFAYDLGILFYYDLKELLHNKIGRHYSSKICEYCGTAFFVGKGNVKLCDDCQNNHIVRLDRENQRAQRDIVYMKIKSVKNTLSYSESITITEEEIEGFWKQANYYRNRFMKTISKGNRIPEYDEELPVIKSEWDIINWCDRFLQRIKVVKNG